MNNKCTYRDFQKPELRDGRGRVLRAECLHLWNRQKNRDFVVSQEAVGVSRIRCRAYFISSFATRYILLSACHRHFEILRHLNVHIEDPRTETQLECFHVSLMDYEICSTISIYEEEEKRLL